MVNDYDVMRYRRSPKEQICTISCCEPVNGNRFIVKQIKLEGVLVSVRLSDGTTAKPEAIKLICEFGSVTEAQSFLLNK